MTAASRARFAEVVRSDRVDLGLACLLIGAEVDAELDIDVPLGLLDGFAAAARPLVPRGAPAAVAAEGLRLALGEQAGFGGAPEDYQDVRSSLLHEVVQRRRGLPLLLSIVWLEVAARLDVPAYALALPGHVIVGIGDPDDEYVLVDPFGGGRVLRLDEADALVRAATGRGLDPRELRPASPEELLLRLLTNVRALSTRQDRLLESSRTRLWAVELSLLLPRSPLVLRRERGELLVRLGQHQRGADDLEDYAAVLQDADPAEAEQARQEARLARARLN